MNIFTLLCVALCVVVCDGRLDAASMRKALNFNPLFSHARDSAVPVSQNFNIHLPVSDPDVPPPKHARPVMAESRVMGGNRGNVVKQQNRRDTPIAAGKPIRHQQVLGQKAPMARGVIDRPIMRTAASKPPIINQQVNNKKHKCSFKIPSFLLPDPSPDQVGTNLKCPSFLLPGPTINPDLVNLMVEHWTGVSTSSKSGGKSLNKVKSQISQVEFEQKCLIPALRAHVVGGPACRSRELTVYLEWLLYLRQRLFNV